MKISLKILGVGGGAAKVLNNQCSTAWVLLIDDAPVLLFDAGLGVTVEYQAAFDALPERLYISHNHSDHAGELPVLLAVQQAQGTTCRIIAHQDVMEKLVSHRLDELRSTGIPFSDYFHPVSLADEQPYAIGPNLYLKTIPTRHAETCYAALIYLGDKLLIGWSADSGFHPALYDAILQAPVCLIDARRKGNPDHVSFAELANYLKDQAPHPNIFIVGYDTVFEPSPYYRQGVAGQEIVVNREG
jgi:ribonuclease BN (tRNA processing enzyme)